MILHQRQQLLCARSARLTSARLALPALIHTATRSRSCGGLVDSRCSRAAVADGSSARRMVLLAGHRRLRS